ncbi:MAG: hypothetical protein EOP47_16400 [Sphingobacteriaceae bacterium]|nr:MAG: hypothetical protein EOP47_16400 [Sphingobacteriaceae bacterium]
MTVRPISALHPPLQFLILAALCIAIVGVGYVVAVAVITLVFGADTLRALTQLNIAVPHVTDALWILQIVGTTLPLLLTPVVFARVIVKEPGVYLKTNFEFDVRLLLIVLLSSLFRYPCSKYYPTSIKNWYCPYF